MAIVSFGTDDFNNKFISCPRTRLWADSILFGSTVHSAAVIASSLAQVSLLKSDLSLSSPQPDISIKESTCSHFIDNGTSTCVIKLSGVCVWPTLNDGTIRELDGMLLRLGIPFDVDRTKKVHPRESPTTIVDYYVSFGMLFPIHRVALSRSAHTRRDDLFWNNGANAYNTALYYMRGSERYGFAFWNSITCFFSCV